jgi:hypothetical protein
MGNIDCCFLKYDIPPFPGQVSVIHAKKPTMYIQAESQSLKLKHGTSDPRNFTELHVTQLILSHYVRANVGTYERHLTGDGTISNTP